MSAMTAEVERLVPSSDDWPLMRGLIIGAAIGAAAVGLYFLGRSLEARRRERSRPIPPPAPPPGPEASPL